MTRRNRIDTTAEAVRIASAGAIIPPAHVPMDAVDIVFFNNVVAEFARAEWSAHQLEVAAMMARNMADMEREQRELRIEGAVMVNARGTPVINPRKTVVQMNASMLLSFRRSLALHAQGQGGDTADIGKRKAAGLAMQVSQDDDDGLLARAN